MKSASSILTLRMIASYCERRLNPILPIDVVLALHDFLTELLTQKKYPPYQGARLDLEAIADVLSMDVALLRSVKAHLNPIFDAVARAVAEHSLRPYAKRRPPKTGEKIAANSINDSAVPTARKTADRVGRPRKPILEFPAPVTTTWDEPHGLGASLRLHIARHKETISHLYAAVVRPEDGLERSTMYSWARADKAPRSVISHEILRRIERRYRLPDGYFLQKAPNPIRAATGHDLNDISPSERRRLAWHLPTDFNSRSSQEQTEILSWVRTVIISGATDYRRYQAAAMRQRYAVRFTCVSGPRRLAPLVLGPDESGVIDAPAQLNAEMADLLKFKTSTLAAYGLQRNGVWGKETASQKIEHFGLWFGAFAAPATSEVQGFGVDPKSLTLAMMVFPQVWDWYLQWREQRRGFYTRWETDMLSIAAALNRVETGWLRQTPRIADHLMEIDGLITQQDIDEAKADWAAACERMYKQARRRIKEIDRVARIHRDPFEPILPILEAQSPVGEYRKITEEILKRMPDEGQYPRAAAEAVRAFLLLRIGLHTGLRQKNLRELLLCKRCELQTSERRLEDMKRGEIRWSSRDGGWEILIPSVAFKNANSSFFGAKPFRLILPDIGNLYEKLEAYVTRHRARLIGPTADPGTFFVKTAKMTSTNAAYDQNTC